MKKTLFKLFLAKNWKDVSCLLLLQVLLMAIEIPLVCGTWAEIRNFDPAGNSSVLALCWMLHIFFWLSWRGISKFAFFYAPIIIFAAFIVQSMMKWNVGKATVVASMSGVSFLFYALYWLKKKVFN